MQNQIALPIRLEPSFTFEQFVVCENDLLVDALKNENEPFVFLWGNKGCGKTHLLQAASQFATQQQQTASYLPLNELYQYPTQILSGLEHVNLVCIDHIETIAGQAEWEEALFNLFNRLKANNARLLISSNTSPQQLPLQLNDLQSRLTSGLALKIKPLTDHCTKTALIKRADQLGLELSHDAANYILSRQPRDFSALCSLLDTLDQASLTAKRKLTIPFIKLVIDN